MHKTQPMKSSFVVAVAVAVAAVVAADALDVEQVFGRPLVGDKLHGCGVYVGTLPTPDTMATHPATNLPTTLRTHQPSIIPPLPQPLLLLSLLF